MSLSNPVRWHPSPGSWQAQCSIIKPSRFRGKPSFAVDIKKNVWLDTGRSGFGEPHLSQLYVV
jgi:hypothetical protein